MSREVDSRTVELQFNSENFEENTQKSISLIDKLMEKLKFKGAEDGFAKIDEAANDVNFDILDKGIRNISSGFSALEVVAVTALSTITNQAVVTGEKITKSLALDSVISGFQEYETQINAVQTILANTQSKGTTLSQVNDALDELNHYADMTIYNFTEMTRNIGTFTAAGVGLETSVAAIKGIANLGAVSGSNSQQVSTAMYQLSQALASGTVKLQDWNSVVNAGMGGQVFQDSLKETARVHGIAIDAMIKKQGSFRETLSQGWLTTDILLETLQKFTGDLSEEQLKNIGYTDDQIKSILELGQTASDAATKVKTFTQLKDTLAEAVQSGWTQTWEYIIGDFDEAKEVFTKISDTLSDIINESSDARNALVLSGFGSGMLQLKDKLGDASNAYENILQSIMLEDGLLTQEQIDDAGSFEKALQKTGVSADILKTALEASVKSIGALAALDDNTLKNEGYDPDEIKQCSEALNSLNEKVKAGSIDLTEYADKLSSISGREHIIQSMWNVWNALKSVIEPVNKAFTEVFASLTGSQIFQFTKKLDEMTAQLTISEETSNKLTRAFKGVFSVLKLGKDALVGIIKYIGKGLGYAKPLVSDFLTIAAAIGDTLVSITEAIRSSTLLTTALSGLEWIARKVVDSVNGLHNFFSKIANNVMVVISPIKTLHDLMCAFISIISPGLTKLGEIAKASFGKFASGAAGAFESINIEKIIQFFSTGVVVGSLAKCSGYIDGIKNAVSGLTGSAKGIIGSFKGIFDSLGEAIDSWKDSKRAEMMMTVAKAVAVMAASLTVLSLIEPIRLASGIVGVKVIITELTNVLYTLYTLNKLLAKGKFSQMTKLTTSMISMSAAVLILSLAVKKMSSLGAYEFLQGLSGTVALLAALAVVASKLSSTTEKFMKGATGLIILSSAVYILAGAVKNLGALSVSELITGLIGVGAVLEELTIFCNYTEANIGILKGAGLVLLASSLRILQKAVSSFGSMGIDALLQGLNAIGIALLEFAAFDALASSSEHIVSSSLSMAVLCASLNVLVKVLTSLSKLSLSEIGNGLLAIEVALASFAIVLNLTDGTLAGAASMIVMAEAINLLAPAMLALGNMSWSQIARGLITMIDALGVVGAAATLMTPVAPIVIGVSLAVSALAISLAALLAVGSVSSVIQGMADSLGNFNMQLSLINFQSFGSLIVSFFVGIITSIAEVLGTVVVSIASIIKSICEAIILAAPAIGEAVKTVILVVCDVIQQCAPQIADTLVVVIEELAVVLCTLISDLFATISPGLETLWNDFTTWITEKIQNIDWLGILISGISGPVGSFIYNLIKQTFGDKDNTESAKTSGEQVAEGYGNGISDGKKSITTKIVEVAQAAANAWNSFWGIASPSKEAAKNGNYIAQGYANGIESGTSAIQSAMQSIAENSHNIFTNFWGIHSPSDLAMSDAENILEGMRLGITDTTKQQEIANQMANLAANVQEAATNGMSSAGTTSGNAFINALNTALSNSGVNLNTISSVFSQYGIDLTTLFSSDSKNTDSSNGGSGTSTNTSTTSSKKSSSSSSSSSKTLAETIEEKYEALFKANKYLQDTADDEWSLWELTTGDTADKTTLLEAQTEKLTKSIDLQAARVEIAQAQYDELKSRVGENDDTTKDAYSTLLSEKQSLVELQRDRIESMYEGVLDRYDSDASRAEAEYNLWSDVYEKTASVTEQQNEKIAYMNRKLNIQAEETKIAGEKYEAYVKEFGEESQLAQEAYTSYLKEQAEQQELQNEIQEQQLAYFDNLISLYDKQATVVSNRHSILADIYDDGELSSREDDYKSAVETYGEDSTEARKAKYQGTMSSIMSLTGAMQSMGTSLKKLTQAENKYDEAVKQANGDLTNEDVLDALSDWESEQSTVVSLAETIAEAFDMSDTGKSAMKKLGYTIAKNWRPIQNGMKKVAAKVSNVLPDSIKNAFSDTMGLMGKEGAEDTISSFTDTVVSMLSGDWGSAIVSAMNTVLNLLNTEYGQTLLEWAAKMAANYLPELSQGLSKLVNLGKTATGTAEAVATTAEATGEAATTLAAAGTEASGLTGIFETLGTVISGIGTNIGGFVTGLFSEGGLLAGLGEGLGGIVTALASLGPEVLVIGTVVAGAAALIIGNFDEISEVVGNVFDQFKEIGANIINGLVEGIKNAWNAVCDFVGNIFSGITDFVCGIFGIHSPSRVFNEIGGYLMEGFAGGITEGGSGVLQAVNDASNEAIDCAEVAAQRLLDAVDNDSSEPLIKPLVDLSAVDESAQWINGVFDGMSETLPLDMSRSASLADDVQRTSTAQKLENARREEANANSYDNSDVVSAIAALGSRMDAVGDSVANLKLVTDTGKLVGELAPGMDEALGKIYSRRRR